MSDPLALVPFALAATTGRINGLESGQLVAAGITLLQRSAPLVKALAGRPSALLLPMSPAWMVAMAASDGRTALMVDPHVPTAQLHRMLSGANVGAVFTLREYSARIPSGITIVELDDVPDRANIIAPTRTHIVDLGSHHGLELTGNREAEGSDERWLATSNAQGAVQHMTHRDVLHTVRAIAAAASYTPADHTMILSPLRTLEAVVAYFVAPLYAGGHMTVIDTSISAASLHHQLAAIGATRIAATRIAATRIAATRGPATRVVATLELLGQSEFDNLFRTAQIAYSIDAAPTAAFSAAFFARTGTVLQCLV